MLISSYLCVFYPIYFRLNVLRLFHSFHPSACFIKCFPSVFIPFAFRTTVGATVYNKLFNGPFQIIPNHLLRCFRSSIFADSFAARARL